MITQLLKELNLKMEILNKIIQDEDYFKNLDERIEKINNHCIKVENEYKELKARIDKSLDYIEENCCNYAGIDEEGIDKLVSILKGDDK